MNAQSDPTFPVKPRARIRLRLINAANARVLTLRFDGVEAQLFALDGAPCRAETVNTIKLAPAQRADVICDLVTEKAFVREISTGTDYPAGHFVATPVLGKATAPKNAINTNLVPPLPDLRQVRRITVHMQGGAMGNLTEARYDGAVLPLRELAQKHKKLWAFNGQIGDYSNIFAEIDLGSVVSLDVINDTAWPHAMHLHGHHFWVMSDDPALDLPSGQRDMVDATQERVSLVFVADNRACGCSIAICWNTPPLEWARCWRRLNYGNCERSRFSMLPTKRRHADRANPAGVPDIIKSPAAIS